MRASLQMEGAMDAGVTPVIQHDLVSAELTRNPGPRRSRAARLFRGAFVPLLALWAALQPVRSAIVDWSHVPSPSMTPTIVEGDNILVNKVAFGLRVPFTERWIVRWSDPERGDIVLLRSPDCGARLVKRVVGLPGDRVAIRDGVLTINGRAVATRVIDPHARLWCDGRMTSGVLAHETLNNGSAHDVLLGSGPAWSWNFIEAAVPSGRCFVLGDNRDDSWDSRVFGCVPLDSVEGRVSWVTVSVDRERLFAVRMDRFFARIASAPASVGDVR